MSLRNTPGGASGGDLDWAKEDLLVRVSWLYFVEELTQADIAQRMGLSRARVIQLLREARQAKVVSIHISGNSYNCLPLERDVCDRLGLADAVVVPTPAERGRLNTALARGAALYLDRTLQNGEVLGTAWGTTLFEVAKELAPTSQRDITVVLLLGGLMSTLEGMNPNEIARLLAERFGGKYYGIYVPAIVDTKRSRDVIINDQSMRETLQLARAARKAIIGIGTADDDATLLRAGFVGVPMLAELRGKGAVGDILARYFDVEGRPVASGFDDRIIGHTLEDLREIETVIAVAGGPNKVRPILGAVRGGYVDVLVTDETTARAVLELAGPDGEAATHMRGDEEADGS